MMFAQFTARRDALTMALDDATDRLKALGAGTGPLGLTPDSVKQSPAYQAARADSARAFAQLRALNGQYVKRFSVELTAERDAKRVARLAINEGK